MDQFLQHLNDFSCTKSGKARLCSIVPFITFLGSCLPFAPNLFHFYGLQRFSWKKKKQTSKREPNQHPKPSWMAVASLILQLETMLAVLQQLDVCTSRLESLVSLLKRKKNRSEKGKELEFLLPSTVLLIGSRTTGIQPFSSDTEDNVTMRNGGSGWSGTRGACCAALTTWVIKCCRRRELGLLWLYLGSLFLINKQDCS